MLFFHDVLNHITQRQFSDERWESDDEEDDSDDDEQGALSRQHFLQMLSHMANIARREAQQRARGLGTHGQSGEDNGGRTNSLLPPLPPLPPLPNLPMPQLPNLNMPNLPNINMPNLPNLPMPNFPDLPRPPKFSDLQMSMEQAMPEEMRQMMSRLRNSMEFHNMLQEYGGFGGLGGDGERDWERDGEMDYYDGEGEGYWEDASSATESDDEGEGEGEHDLDARGARGRELWMQRELLHSREMEGEGEGESEEDDIPGLLHSDSDGLEGSDDEDEDEHRGNQEFLGKGFGKGIC